MTTKPIAASSPPREGFFVSDGLAEPYQLGDLFQLATPDISSNVAKLENDMTVQSGALRCKDGDLAVVINDTIDCRQNIGRVVQVRGPVRKLKQSGMQGWLIKPIHKRVWGVTELDGRNVKELVFWRSGVFHEDAWLMPIRPQSPDEVWQETQEKIDRILINMGAFVPIDAPITLPHESDQSMRPETAQATYDPLEQVLRDNPTLTREKAEEMAHAFGF
jgi:hypothetical protein